MSTINLESVFELPVAERIRFYCEASVIKSFISFALLIALTGCSVPTLRHHYAGNVISFIEINSVGKEIRRLSFALTQESAETCLAGEWKQAKAISGDTGYTKNPAYTLKNGQLEVLLINDKCDLYDSYIGKISHGQFRGSHVDYGLGFNKTINNVTGEYIPEHAGEY